MAWNPPSNDKQEKDPWNEKDEKYKHVNKNKKSKSYSFLELEYLVKFFKSKRKKFLNNSRLYKYVKHPIIFIILVTIILFIISGFYSIKESDRGVVTCFGKFSYLSNPGLNWRPILIYQVFPVNVEIVRDLITSGMVLTSDKNFIRIDMNVQYRITNPQQYLFSITNFENSLHQVTDSVLRNVIGHFNMNYVLSEEKALIRNSIREKIQQIIQLYKMGITILDVNFNVFFPSKEIELAFNNFISENENQKRCLQEAKVYSREIMLKTYGQAQRILENAKAYKSRIVFEAQGNVIRFSKILPIYLVSKEITIKRLYIECIEKLFSHSKKMLIDINNPKMLLLLLNNLSFIKDDHILLNSHSNSKDRSVVSKSSSIHVKNVDHTNVNDSLVNSNNIIDQRKLNSFRTNYFRVGRE